MVQDNDKTVSSFHDLKSIHILPSYQAKHFQAFLPAAISRQVSQLKIVVVHHFAPVDSTWFRLYTVGLQMEA